MADFQPPPTYALPIRVNEKNPRESTFDPIWLKWFVDLAAVLSAVGAGSGGVDHNLLTNLQGGTTDEYYHFTDAEHTSLSSLITAQSANTFFSGPASGVPAVPTFRAIVLADIPNNLIDNTKLADMAQSTIKGRTAGAGTGDPVDLTAAQTRTILGLATGDSPSFTGLTVSGLTADRVVVTTTGGLLAVDANLAWINASDILISGHTTALTGWNTTVPRIQVSGANSIQVALGGYVWGANTEPANIIGNKSRNATPGSHTILQNGDYPLQLVAAGSDGTNFEACSAISFGLDGTPGNNDMPGKIEFFTTPDGTAAPAYVARMDNAQRTIFGSVAAITVGNAGKIQINGTTDATSQAQLSRFSANADGPAFAKSKSRHATEGSNTIVQSGDALGSDDYYGANGTSYTLAARRRVLVNGTPGAATDMPGAIVDFCTPDGSGTPLETLRQVSVASAVNSLEISNAATGNPPQLLSRGSDTDIDLYLVPKGAGVVRFGTHTAIGVETVTGYITIKDAGGTNRKLAVVS